MEEEKNKKEEAKIERQMVSFSNFDEKGNFRETYGYIEKESDGPSFEERIKEMSERIKKR